MSHNAKNLVIAVLTVLVGILGTITITIDGDKVTVTRVAPTRTIVIPQPVAVDPGTQLSKVQQAEDSTRYPNAVGVDLHEDSKDETPPGVSKEELKQGEAQTQAAADAMLVAPSQPAGAQNYDCRKHYVVNQSALTHKVIGVAMHFTVSDPGSLDAIRRLFNTPAFGASSTFGFELYNGRCEQWVPLNRKAWAQLSANSYYWSIEIASKDRSRASWLAAPAIKNGSLAGLVSDLLKQAGAPPRLVDPQGCTFLPGVVDHSRLECGNTHWDVGKNFPWDVFMHQVRLHYYGSDCSTRCKRTKDLRLRHKRTHKAIRDRNCSIDHPKHEGCKQLVRRNSAIHAAAKKERIKL